VGSAEPGTGGDFADRRQGQRGMDRGSGAGPAGVIDAVHRAQYSRLVEQHRAGDGAEHHGGDVRSRSSDAVGGGDEAKGALSVIMQSPP